VTVDRPPMRAPLAAHAVIEDLVDQHDIPTRSRLARLLSGAPSPRVRVAGAARGDITVSAALAKLPAEWRVFHSLPVGTSQSKIGRLVVGPNGVFTITMRDARGQNIWVFKRLLLVAGTRVSYLRDAESEAERATRVLRKRMPEHGAVRPVIALANPREVVIREKPAEVKVINARHLTAWLLRQPATLSDRELHRIMTIVDDSKTWGAARQVNAHEVMTRFAALERVVSRAHRRRLWLISGVTALVVGIVGVETVIVLNVVTSMLADLDVSGSVGP